MKDFEPIWTSQDGRITPISKLDSAHLSNIIALLRRRAMTHRPELSAIVANYPFNEYIVEVDEACAQLFGEWPALVQEAVKRNLGLVKPPVETKSNTGWVAAGAALLAVGVVAAVKANLSVKINQVQTHQAEV